MIQTIFFLLLFSSSIFCFSQTNSSKMVVLGLDGLDAELTEKWMKEGQLPHLQKLSQQGSYQRLATSNPAQSPVAWSTMITGTNPGKHNIFDFLRRGEKSYHPRLGLADVKLVSINNFWVKLGASFGISILFLSFVYFFSRHSQQGSFYRKIGIGFSIAIAWMIWFALAKYVPQQLPWPKSLRQGSTLWEIAGNHTIPSIILDAPMAFPSELFPQGQLYCGLGVPDVLGTNGIWFRYSSLYPNPIPTETGGWKMPLEKLSDTHWRAKIIGPKNLLAVEEYNAIQEQLKQTTDLTKIKILRNRLATCQTSLSVLCDIHSKNNHSLEFSILPFSQTVQNGEWTQWIPITFEMSPLIQIKGITRIRVLQLNPPELYISPIQFDPTETPINVTITSPRSFGKQLAQEYGLYPTLGWPEATNALKDEEIPEEVFWEDMKGIFEQRKNIFLQELRKKNYRLIMGFFYAPDRASHMYWRFLSDSHPQFNDPTTKQWHNALFQVYQWCDELVGETMKHIGNDDTLLVLSDHGFASFDWEVNLNTWLYENGYLILDKHDSENRLQINDLYEGNRIGKQVNWEKTRAYGMGLGGIYLNLRDRDPNGIVEPGTPASELAQEIIQKLKNTRHNGQPVIHSVHTKEEIYQGQYTQEAPDLIVGFCKGYRVAWQSTLGAISQHVIEPNTLKWSGDHCSIDPTLIPGVLFSNQPLPNHTKAHLTDIAPTILDYFQIPIPDNMDGQSLWKK